MIATQPPLLAPSEILWKDQLDQISQLLQTHKVIFVRGKPGIGKSTLLRQLEKFSQPESVCFIDFRNQISLTFALSMICEKLQKPYQGKASDLKNELPELIQHSLKALETSGKIIALDNAHQIEEIGRLLDELLSSGLKGRIVASCRETIAINPLQIMDCGFVDLEGFSANQVQEFISRSQLKYDLSNERALAQHLWITCESNPMILKWTLAPFLLGRQEVTVDNIRQFNEAAHEKYVDFILKEFRDTETQRTLKLASLVTYSNDLEKQILGSLDPIEFSLLENCGVITHQNNSSLLSKALRPFIQKTISSCEQEVLTNEIVEKCKDLKSYDSLKELIFHLQKSGNKTQVAKLLSRHYSDFLIVGDGSTFLELSSDCFDLLDTEAFLLRRMELNSFDRLAQTEFETTVFLANKELPAAERAVIMTYHAALLRRIGRYSEALSVLKQVLKSSEISEPTRCFAQICLTRIYFLQNDLKASNDELEKIPTLDLCALSGIDAWIYDEALINKAFHLECLGRFEEALKIYEEIESSNRDQKAASNRLLDRLNVSNTKYRLGRVREAMEELAESKRLYEKIVDSTHRSYINYDSALHAMNQGRFMEAVQILDVENERFACNSNAKSVALHYLTLLKSGRISEINELRIAEHGSLFDGRGQSFPYLFMRISQQAYLNDSNLFGVVDQFDHATDLRISLVNALLEQRWKLGSSLNLAKLSEIRDYEKQQFDFYILLERECLLGLHYLLSERKDEARSLLERALEKATDSEFFVWEARSSFGLGCLEIMKGNFHEGVRYLERSKALHFSFDPIEDLGLEHLLQFAKLEITPEEFKKLAEAHPLLKLIFQNSRIGTKTTYLLRNKLGTFEIEAKEVGKKRYTVLLDLSKNKLHLGSSEIDLSSKPILKSLWSLFLRNPDKTFSKDELIERVWMESYNPIYHDSRVYTTLKRFRQMMSEAKVKSTIEHVDSGYRFVAYEDFAIIEEQSELSRLSDRQQWIISYLEKNGNLSRTVLEKALKISPSLAGSELKALVNQGWLEMHGQGKSTAYKIRT